MDRDPACPPPDQAAELDQAIQDHQAGRLALAQDGYRRILARDPDHPDALHLLGMLACDQGDIAAGLALIDTALRHAPTNAAFHNSRGRALVAAGELAGAEAAYRSAWSSRPDSPEIANNLGCLLRDRGDLDGAVAWLTTAARLAPRSADIACNLADALAARGAVEASLTLFRHALTLRPDSADIHARFGRVLAARGRHRDAADSFRTSLRLRPDHAPTHTNLGLVSQILGDPAAAMECFRSALRHDPRCADAHYNLGCLLALDGQARAARDCHDRAVAADPLHGAALWARCMAELPVLYEQAADIRLQRARYAQRLAELDSSAADPAVAAALTGAIGASQPFFLPYQGQDDRSLQARYGRLLVRLTGDAAPPGPQAGKLIRVGLVSGFFQEHTIWRLMLKGWLTEIDRDRFELHAYHTGTTTDEQTQAARDLCPNFTAGDGIADAIGRDRPHVLLYPELGIDPVAIRLAARRLAPVQCVAWGQPVTSGLPTMDYFLSSELMEPAGAAAHYTETLIALPNLGIHYTPEPATAEVPSRAAMGLRPDAAIFWCGQALYKYLPQYDDILARIAAQVGDCQFLFIGFAKSQAVTRQMQRRLGHAFAARGLDAGRHCVFLDPMPQDRFLGSIRLADVVLDSIGWSGGKSTLDALSQAPAIVTHAGPFMRGRHTAAILTRIGAPETIAATLDDYVRIAVRLIADPAERSRVRAGVVAGRHLAMADTAPVRALEAFMERAVSRLAG